MIIYLNVPYEDRLKAKSAGALWNPARKKWYVEDMNDLSAFTRWMNDHLTAPHKETKYEKEFKARAALSKNNKKGKSK